MNWLLCFLSHLDVEDFFSRISLRHGKILKVVSRTTTPEAAETYKPRLTSTLHKHVNRVELSTVVRRTSAVEAVISAPLSLARRMQIFERHSGPTLALEALAELQIYHVPRQYNIEVLKVSAWRWNPKFGITNETRDHKHHKKGDAPQEVSAAVMWKRSLKSFESLR